jgi:hypothetical protein
MDAAHRPPPLPLNLSRRALPNLLDHDSGRRIMANTHWASVAGLCGLALLVTGCGGGGGGSSGFTIGGTLQGLGGGTVVLRNNGRDDLSLRANGPFTFETELANGGAYSVTVRTQPASQFCTVVNPSGTVSAEDVDNVRVNCVPTYTVGGSVTGLSGGTLVLRNNGGDDLAVSASGPFTFATGLVNNGAYAVTVHTQPAGHFCSVTGNGSGTVSGADVTSVEVTCEEAYTIGGSVSGLSSGALVLQNNGADDLGVSADGGFTFASALPQGAPYAVTVKTQPADLVCAVADGSGTVGATDVTDVAVSCAALDTPAALSLAYGVKQLHFSWTAVDGATFYQLRENPGDAAGYAQIGGDLPVPAASYDHGIFLPRRLGASYILSACNDVGCKDSAPVFVSSSLVEAVGYLKASTTGQEDGFGLAVALSADGTTLAVGATGEDSADGNDPANDGATNSGAAYVFTYDGTDWTQQAYLKASNAEAGDILGSALALSADGNTLAVAATFEDSAGGGETDDCGAGDLNCAYNSGAVYVFTRDGSSNWTQQAYLKASNPGGGVDDQSLGDGFGASVALGAGGNTLAVGAVYEDSADGNNPANDSAQDSGAVYVFTRDGSNNWTQQAYLKASNIGTGDWFGARVALNADDGNTLAAGVFYEDSADGNNPADDSAQDSGAVYVFTRDGSSNWAQQAYLKASNIGVGDLFGYAVSLSGDGNTLAAGALLEDGAGTGLDGDPANNGEPGSGAAYVFTRDGSNNWTQQAYVKASNTEELDEFGRSVALSGDGDTLAVGAWAEDGGATGLGGNQASDGAQNAGAAYLYRRASGVWSPAVVYIKASNTEANDSFGWALALSADGETMAAGAYREGANLGDQAGPGAVYLY